MATVQSRTHEQVVHQALEVMLQQQLPEAWDVQTLCSLLQVSTACRKAVSDSGVSCELCPQHFAASGSSDPSMQRIMGFASWLPNHAPLVSSLELRAPHYEADTAVVEQLLTMAVKLCAHQQALPAQSRTATGLTQPLAGLRLKSLEGNLLLQPAALTALAAGSHLTRLCWQELQPGNLSAPVLQALGQLTSLKSWEVHGTCSISQQDSVHLAASLANLQKLERLVCTGSTGLSPACLLQLPCSLTHLGMRLPTPSSADIVVVCDLEHLTALRSLLIAGLWEGPVSSVLPPSLSSLTVVGARFGANVQSLPRVVYLNMTVDFTQPNLLQHVHGMPLLRKLDLGLALVGGRGREPLTERQAQDVAAVLAAATQVTSLKIYRNLPDSASVRRNDADAEVCLRDSLLHMRRLSSLLLEGIRLDSRDVLGWTSLSALKCLSIAECSGVTDMAVAALACKLPGLERLKVDDCGLSSPVLWPGLACCTSLIQLVLLQHAVPLKDEALLFLTSLTRLTTLSLRQSDEYDVEVPWDAAVQQFRAAMPQLRRLNIL